MKLEFDLISILDTAGLIQGVLLGIVLIILNRKKSKSTFFLGLFLILYAIQRLPVILKDIDAYAHYPELYLLPFNFFWLLFPLFFLYTQQVSVFSRQKTNYWLLAPGIVSCTIQFIIFLLPYQTKIEILPNLWRHELLLLGLILGWAIGIYNLKLINLHNIEVQNFYSMVESKELKWARTFLIFGIIGSMLYMVQLFLISENSVSRVFYIIFDLTIIYWLSYHGIVQRNVLSILAQKDLIELPKNILTESVSVTTAPTKELEETMSLIDEYMVKSESFSHTELTLVDLAKELNIHPKRISTAINTIRKHNFNYYVNRFRIEKAEVLLRDKSAEHLSVEGIGKEVGFHSKSAFYGAFKKFTGTTPIKFKESLAA